MVRNDIDPKQWARFERDLERKERKKAERDAERELRKAQWGDPASNLFSILETRITQYDWGKEGRNRASREQKADILGVPSSTDAPKVFIEFELERATCVRNVIKSWMYVENDSGEAILIHVSSPFLRLPNADIIWRRHGSLASRPSSRLTVDLDMSLSPWQSGQRKTRLYWKR